MEKHLKKLLNRYEKLLEVSDKINSWFIETNRKYMTIEQDNYYLKWRSEYLEKWIKKNNPAGVVVTILCDRGERYFSCL